MNECAFSTKDPTYLDYHDNVWGQPIYDSKALFKLMALESQHAGLSWLTILKETILRTGILQLWAKQNCSDVYERYRWFNGIS